MIFRHLYVALCLDGACRLKVARQGNIFLFPACDELPCLACHGISIGRKIFFKG